VADEDLVAQLPDGLVVLDAAGQVRLCNPAAAALLGRPAEDIVGGAAEDALGLTDEAGRSWWTCTAALRRLPRVRATPEQLLTLPDGTGLRVTARFVRAAPGDVAAGQVVRTLVSLRPDRARVAAERGAAELLTTVAHELRSPLAGVKGFTSTLMVKWERFTDDQRRHMIATINADAERVARLLAELLDVSRIDSGRLEVHRQLVDLAEVVDRAVATRVAAGEDPARFVVTPPDPLPELWLDPVKIDQVVGNLLDNALRHGAGTVTVDLSAEPDGAVLRVRDEGEGVPVDIRDRVFSKFFRGRARHGGTGLGLYLVRGLVTAHGGQVAVLDEPGGACFEVRLPRGSAPFPDGDRPPAPAPDPRSAPAADR
jgi:signal transduction histidine kinase